MALVAEDGGEVAVWLGVEGVFLAGFFVLAFEPVEARGCGGGSRGGPERATTGTRKPWVVPRGHMKVMIKGKLTRLLTERAPYL